MDTLKSDIFTPKYKTDGSFDSDTTKVAKLKFGKNYKSAVQEWYILGKDDQVKDEEGSTDNIAIFAASNIITSQQFHNNLSYHVYDCDSDSDIDYVKGKQSDDKNVAPNHYGGSDIRAVLRKMSGDVEDTDETFKKYFTDTEKQMMQKTTVLVRDYDKDAADSSNNKLYTTSDKLYLASGKNSDNNYIYVGSVSKSGDNYTADNDEYTSKKLYYENYWHAGSWFWLRSPYPNYDHFGLYAYPDYSFIYNTDVVNYNIGVRPASNLDLSSVLFASAADAASASDSGAVNTIDRGTDTATNAAMTLRIDGDSKSAETALGGTIGSVKLVNNSKIVITRGTATAAVTLIIQGKDGDTDWYYAKNITAANASTPVTASDITGHTSADLSKCRIWLEAPMGDGSTLSYGVKATNHTHHYIKKHWVSDAGSHWLECIGFNCPDPDKGKKDVAAHSYGSDDTWYYDEEYHYKKCTVCESDKSIKADTKEAHTYGTDGKCTTCGYDINSEHPLEQVDEVKPTCTSVGYESYYRCKDEGCDVKYRSALGILIRFTDMSEIELPKAEHVESDSYSHDSSSHWLTCVNCGEPLKKASHKLSSDYNSDDESHWKVCTICEAELEVTAHEPGTDYIYDSDSHWKTCTDCGEKLSEASHKSDIWQYDADKHWRVCSDCGMIYDTAAHEIKLGTCTSCGYKSPKTTRNRSSESLPVNTNNVTHGVWERDSRGWRYKLLNGSYAGYSNSAADGSTAKIDYAGDTNNATANSAASAVSNPTGQTAGTDKEQISWFKINNADYAFAADGYLRTGWVYDAASGRWYYCDENKGKLNGWFFDTADGYWYYLDPRTGEMLSGWQLINGREYYLAPAPQESTYTYDSTQNKWVYNNAKAYRPFGSLYVNTVTPDGYYVDADGAKTE